MRNAPVTGRFFLPRRALSAVNQAGTGQKAFQEPDQRFLADQMRKGIETHQEYQPDNSGEVAFR